MGRRRESNFDDPPRFHRKGKVWYHVSGAAPRVWTKLSDDRAEALRLWAQLEGVRADDSTRLFSVVARRYVREVFPTKAASTRRDNEKEMANLLKVFAHMPIDAIAPMHIRGYLDIRGQVAKVRANREKALFSHMFNKAREWGFTALQNPCQGVKGFKETGRTRYVTDAEFDQVKAHAHFTVIDAMDLALLTGQRPADVLKLKRTDIRDGTLRSCFDKARLLAKVDFQFRDIRAKAATDTGDLAHSPKLLAHKNRDMTEHYVRARIGERVRPLR